MLLFATHLALASDTRLCRKRYLPVCLQFRLIYTVAFGIFAGKDQLAQAGHAMTPSQKERLSLLREKILRQRDTVDALKRDGHVYADAERELRQMIAELQASETERRSA